MSVNKRITDVRRELKSLERELVIELSKLKDRRRAPKVRQLHEVRSMLDPVNGYASQAGQDRILAYLFKGKKRGQFVDVGAYDGVTGSNSLYFERHLGWTGLLVEPVEQMRLRAEVVRSSPCLPYAVSDADGEASFLTVTKGYTQMSGLVDAYDPDLLQKVRDSDRHEEEKVTVQTRRLERLLVENDMPNPEFVSLDIEGGELAVLRSFNFGKHRVGAWAIENNSGTSEIAQIMQQNGYKLVEFCGPDEIYALEQLS